MDPIVAIVADAKREVLAHTIESTRGLHAYLDLHGGAERLSLLQEEAVRQGLYRYMGKVYAEVLETTLKRTRRCILAGRIVTDDELKRYLVHLAGNLEQYRDLDRIINDLFIEARQTGLYSLLPKKQPAQERPHADAFCTARRS